MADNLAYAVLGAFVALSILAIIAMYNPAQTIPPTPAFSEVVTSSGRVLATAYNQKLFIHTTPEIIAVANSTGLYFDLYNLPYAQISSLDSQTCQNGVATNVTLDTNDGIYKMTHSETVNNNLITIQERGIYQIIGVPQIGEITNPADGIFNIWIQRNGADLQNTNIKAHIEHQATDIQTLTATLNWVGELNANDIISFQMSCTDNHIGILATADTAVEPATPSIIISIFKIGW